MHVMFPWRVDHRSADFRLVGQSLSAQQSISGAFTVLPSMSAHWMATLDLRVYSDAQLLQVRGFLAQMEGMLGTTDVPCLAWFRPLDSDGHEVAMNNVATIADAQTMEHWGFANAPSEAAVIAESAALRATQMKVIFVNSTGLRPGHRFSIAGHLHEVQLTWVNDFGDNIVQFQPPLRAAVAASEVVELHHPTCKMRLATSDEMGPVDSYSPVRTFTLSFIEAL